MNRFRGWFQKSNGDRAWGVYYRGAEFCFEFFVGKKNPMQRIFIKKYFLFAVGSVCLVKRFTTGCQTFSCWRRSWNGGAEVADTTVKRLLCRVFRRTGKAMGQVYQYWWRIWRDINVSSGLEYHTFCVLYEFVTYLPSFLVIWYHLLLVLILAPTFVLTLAFTYNLRSIAWLFPYF
jgi:hypothetical protein